MPTIVRLIPQDFQLVAGDDKLLQVTVLDENDAVVDLSGATISWAMSKRADSKVPLVSKATGSGVVAAAPTTGVFVVTVLAADTVGLASGKYHHEAQVVSADTTKATVL